MPTELRTKPGKPVEPESDIEPDITVEADPAEQYRTERTKSAVVTEVSDVVPELSAEAGLDELEAAGVPLRPIPLTPFRLRRSGIYQLDVPVLTPSIPSTPHLPLRPPDGAQGATSPLPTNGVQTEPDLDQAAGPLTPLHPRFGTEELRVDVDGVMPTMTISGTITRLFGGRLTWIARVTRDPATGAWTGPISYRDGTTSLRPYDTVSVLLTGSQFTVLTRRATATFRDSASSRSLTLSYTFAKAAFRDVAFEYDTVSDATAVTSHNPTSHPIHHPAVPNTTLTIESAYARIGVQVTKTGGDSAIPIGDAGANTTWSDQEMHDAMQAHWSRWVDSPQWAVWVLFARLHDQGTSLGGIMFDDIGNAQRQGTSIFSGSFVSQAPAGEANPGPWVERMRFWTAMHEIGHSFNLAHSWQKSLGTSWVPLADEPSALSYMNYPYNYPGGLDAFFAAFQYGFSPDELLFMRHAPERFVEMGAEPWFSNHAFEKGAFDQLRAAVTGPLELEIRVHREPRYEFLEPVVAELRLKNVSSTPVVVDADVLRDDLAIVVAKQGGDVKRWLPFARYCTAPSPTVLQPDESMYSSVFLSAGTGGWLIDEPGTYTVYAATDAGQGTAALSRPLTLMVEHPADAESERLAGDFFSKEVAHTLAFGGSRVLDGANDTLERVAEVLPGSKVAVHATTVRGTPMAADGKVLQLDADGRESVAVVPAAPGEARELLSTALGDFDQAADALGHIEVTTQTKRLAAILDAEGDTSARTDLLNTTADALAQRGVLPGVVEALRQE